MKFIRYQSDAHQCEEHQARGAHQKVRVEHRVRYGRGARGLDARDGADVQHGRSDAQCGGK